MKKMTKKLGAIVLALAMCFSLCCTALAAEGEDNYTLTIENSSIGKTYNVYKIFDATYDGDGAVAYTISRSNTSWYTIVSEGYQLDVEEEDGQTTTKTVESPFTLTPTTTDGTTYTVTVKSTVGTEENPITVDDQYIINFFTDYVDANFSSLGTPTTSKAGTGEDLTIDLNDPGYYYVTTTTGSLVSITTAAPDATVVDKDTPPGNLEKIMNSTDHTGEQQSGTHTDQEAVGDHVEFIVTADVPLYSGKYMVTDYEFTDTLTIGMVIDLDKEDVVIGTGEDAGKYFLSNDKIDDWVTIGSASDSNVKLKLSELVGNYYVELTGVVETDDGYTASGFVLYYETYDYDSVTGNEKTADEINTGKYPLDATITIDYTTHVTEQAEYDNENDIYMTWDVTPFNYPTPKDPIYGGEDEDYDDVYVATLQIFKVDANGMTTPLSDATFELTGTHLHDVVINEKTIYTPLEKDAYDAAVAAGTTLYFRLYEDATLTDPNNFYYTTVDPYTLDDDSPELVNYIKTENAPEDYQYTAYTMEVTEEVEYLPVTGGTVSGTTDENGYLTFKGLRQGTYTLTETKAPDGYNLLPDTITINVTFVIDNDDTAEGHFAMTAVNSSGDPVSFAQDVDTGTFTFTIANSAGTELPGTGGIGTTIFYIIGGVLVVGAVVVLVTRRRMTREG